MQAYQTFESTDVNVDTTEQYYSPFLLESTPC